MSDSRHFGKTVKLSYLRKRLTDFDEIWHADAEPVSEHLQLLKMQNLEIKMLDVSNSDANRLANVKVPNI